MHPPTMAAAVVIRPPEAATRPHSRRGSIQQSDDRRIIVPMFADYNGRATDPEHQRQH
jgi:hypothetical protein